MNETNAGHGVGAYRFDGANTMCVVVEGMLDTLAPGSLRPIFSDELLGEDATVRDVLVAAMVRRAAAGDAAAFAALVSAAR